MKLILISKLIPEPSGDTSHLKKNQLLNPPNILMTTIESFAILMSEKSSYKFLKKY